jgi:hypothetical protein
VVLGDIGIGCIMELLAKVIKVLNLDLIAWRIQCDIWQTEMALVVLKDVCSGGDTMTELVDYCHSEEIVERSAIS